MDFFHRQSWQVALWWDWWCSETITWLWINAYSLPRGNAIDKIFWYQQRNHDCCKKKSKKKVYRWKNYTRHFTPLSSSEIGHKLSSENDSFEDTFDFNLPTTLDIADITPSTCYMSVLLNLLGMNCYRC